jgi:hypothetical protein
VTKVIGRIDVPVEEKLRSAFVLACFEEWSGALLEIDQGLEAVAGAARVEFLFLKCVILRKLDRVMEAAIVCKEGLELNGQDPRLNRELSILVWRAARDNENGVVDKFIELVGERPSLDLALRLATKAVKESGADDMLRIHTSNTLAHLHVERNAPGDLATAATYSLELEKLPRSRWPGRFFHTVARIQHERGRAAEDPSTKRGTFQKANELYRRALGEGGFNDRERRLVEQHLSELNEDISATD